jgi:integrase
MRVIVNDSELYSICSDIVYSSLLYSKALKMCANVQFMTGARANDVLDFSRWAYIGSSTFTLNPQKGNLQRVFNVSELPPAFAAMLQANINPFNRIFYRKYEYYVNQVIGWRLLECGDRGLSTHIFRHNYARQLKVNGWSDNDIRLKLGETHLSSAQAYIYSNITQFA